MQVVIHAGGQGTRLRPLTDNKPKALVDVNGKKLIEIAIQPLIRAGITNFALTVSYKADMLKDFLKNNYPKLSFKFIDEPKPAGRAGAIRLGIEQGILDINEPTIITRADDIIEFDFNDIIKNHENSGCKLTLALSKSFRNPYGVAKIENNRVIGFEEKPLTKLQNQGINAGIEILSDLKDFENIEIPSHPEYNIYLKLAKENQINVFFVDKWLPVNTKEELKELMGR